MFKNIVNFIKKPLHFILLLAALGGFLSVYFYFTGQKTPAIETVAAKRGNLEQIVGATGRVKPAQTVDLAFEKSGKIAEVLVAIGDSVRAGDALISLNNSELAAQLNQAAAQLEAARINLDQYNAALDAQTAKLDELKRGARPEEIQIAQTDFDNARVALSDAENNLTNVKNKADGDLNNLYNGIKDILNDSYLQADDALNKQLSPLFTNGSSASPALTFNTDTQTKNDAETKRASANNALLRLQNENTGLSDNQTAQDTALNNAKKDLNIIIDMLNSVSAALNGATDLTSTVLSSYKTSANLARANINSTLASVNAKIQAIGAQKTLNQSNINTAQTNLNAAKNTLAAEEDALALKKAGSAPETIANQEALVRQAQANINAQSAQIKSAAANKQNIEAQIAKTVIRSPIDGVIIKQDAKVGEIFNANAIVVSVNSASQFEIETNLPEADIAKIKIGAAAKITLDAYGNDANFDATVVSIEPAETIVEGVATYKTKLHFTKEDDRVKSGMTANIDILTAKRGNAIIIPQRAVAEKNGRKIVKILDNKNIIEREVQTGLRGSDGNLEILSGLAEGEKVITSQTNK